ELNRAVRGAERAVHKTFEGARDAGADALGTVVGAVAGFAKTFQNAFNFVFGWAMAGPKDTPAQARQKAQARGNEETLHAEKVAAHTQANEEARDYAAHAQKTDQQERDLEFYQRFGLIRGPEPDQPREVQPYDRERERER